MLRARRRRSSPGTDGNGPAPAGPGLIGTPARATVRALQFPVLIAVPAPWPAHIARFGGSPDRPTFRTGRPTADLWMGSVIRLIAAAEGGLYDPPPGEDADTQGD